IALHEIGWSGLNEELSAAYVNVCRLALGHNISLQHRNVIAHVLSSVEPPSLRDLDAALQLAERGLQEAERADDDYLFGYLDPLAHVYAACGRLDEAIDVQRRAIEIAPPDDPEFADLQKHLDAYLARAGTASGQSEQGKTPEIPGSSGSSAAPLG